MFVAHLPAGYLLTRALARRPSRGLVAIGLAASVLPDLDLLRFYVLDHRRVLHHAYWTHQPLWWVLGGAAWLGLAALLRRRDWVLPGVVLFGNLLLHLALDTVAGGVRWLAPFSDRSFVLATVPARHGWWVWNFLLGLDQDREAPAP